MEVNKGGNTWHEKVSTQLQSVGIVGVMRMHEKGISFATTTRLYEFEDFINNLKDPSTKRTYQGERTFGCTCRDPLPWFQAQGRVQKVESRVDYIKLTDKYCVHTETNQKGQGTNWCTSHRWHLRYQEIVIHTKEKVT